MRSHTIFDDFKMSKIDPSPLKITISRGSKTVLVKGLADPSPTLHPFPITVMKGVKGLFSRRSVENIYIYNRRFNPSPPPYPCKNPSTLHTNNGRGIGVFTTRRLFFASKSQSVKGEAQTLHRPFTDPSPLLLIVTGLVYVTKELNYGGGFKYV